MMWLAFSKDGQYPVFCFVVNLDAPCYLRETVALGRPRILCYLPLDRLQQMIIRIPFPTIS